MSESRAALAISRKSSSRTTHPAADRSAESAIRQRVLALEVILFARPATPSSAQRGFRLRTPLEHRPWYGSLRIGRSLRRETRRCGLRSGRSAADDANVLHAYSGGGKWNSSERFAFSLMETSRFTSASET